MGNEYTHIILNLVAVLVLMFGLVFILKKLKLSKFATNKHIKIINMVAVGAKEKIILMEVNNAFLLVGATPNHIETLYVFNELEPVKSTTDEEVAQKSSFSERMRSLIS